MSALGDLLGKLLFDVSEALLGGGGSSYTTGHTRGLVGHLISAGLLQKALLQEPSGDLSFI